MNDFTGSRRPSIPAKPHSLKNHFRGALKEAISLGEKLANTDRFFFAGINAFKKHCRRYQKDGTGKPYKERMLWMCIREAERLGMFIPVGFEVRHSSGGRVRREGWIVADHDQLAEVIDGSCFLLPLLTNAVPNTTANATRNATPNAVISAGTVQSDAECSGGNEHIQQGLPENARHGIAVISVDTPKNLENRKTPLNPTATATTETKGGVHLPAKPENLKHVSKKQLEQIANNLAADYETISGRNIMPWGGKRLRPLIEEHGSATIIDIWNYWHTLYGGGRKTDDIRHTSVIWKFFVDEFKDVLTAYTKHQEQQERARQVLIEQQRRTEERRKRDELDAPARARRDEWRKQFDEASFAIPRDVTFYVLDNPPPDNQLDGYIQRREDDVLNALMLTKAKLEPPPLFLGSEPELDWIRQYQAHGLFLSLADFDAQPAPPSGVLVDFAKRIREMIETQSHKIVALHRYNQAEAVEQAA